MGCNCGSRKQNVEYVVTFSRTSNRPGEKETFESVNAAQAAVRAAGGGMYRAQRKAEAA